MIELKKTEIENRLGFYEYDMRIMRTFRYVHLIFLFLTFIAGYILFVRQVRKRKKLRETRFEINNMINLCSSQLTLDEFLAFKSRLIKARRY